MPSPKPSLQALLVCDTVIIDAATGKKSIINTFTHIMAMRFPCQQPQMGIYFCITDAEGEYNFRLDFVQINSDKIIGSANINKVTIKSRLVAHDFGIRIPSVVFPEPGRYEYRLFANDEFIGNKDFNVVQAKKPESS